MFAILFSQNVPGNFLIIKLCIILSTIRVENYYLRYILNHAISSTLFPKYETIILKMSVNVCIQNLVLQFSVFHDATFLCKRAYLHSFKFQRRNNLMKKFVIDNNVIVSLDIFDRSKVVVDGNCAHQNIFFLFFVLFFFFFISL